MAMGFLIKKIGNRIKIMNNTVKSIYAQLLGQRNIYVSGCEYEIKENFTIAYVLIKKIKTAQTMSFVLRSNH